MGARIMAEPNYDLPAGFELDGAAPAPSPRSQGSGARTNAQSVIEASGGARVSSAYRDPSRNANAGGAPNSHHTRGTALDFTPAPGETMAKLEARLRASGIPFAELLNEGDHVHVAWDGDALTPDQTVEYFSGGGQAPADYGLPEGFELEEEIVAPEQTVNGRRAIIEVDDPVVTASGTMEDPFDLTSREDVNLARKGDFFRDREGGIVRALGEARMGSAGEEQAPGIYARESGLGDAIGAGAMAASEQIPFLDESVAFTTGLATGEGYQAMRDRQQAVADVDREQYGLARNAGGVAGFGLGLLAPGGALINRGGGLGGRTIRSLGVGAGYGGLYGAGASEGGLDNRLNDMSAGAVLGSVTGAAAPAVVWGASALATPATNFLGRQAYNLSGGRMAQRYSPRSIASRELGNAMRDEGITEDLFTQTMNRLRGSGTQPTLLDVVQEARPNGKTARAIRGSAMFPDASTIATQYAMDVAEQVPALGQNLTRALAPDGPTTPAMLGAVESRIANALPPMNVPQGSGGEAVSRALNAARDAAKREVDEAYDAARALDPEMALVPSNVARDIYQNVTNSLSDFDMADVPAVGRVMERLSSPLLKGQRGHAEVPSVRSLFEARSRLSQIRANGTQMEQAAAGRAIRELDGEITRIADDGLIQGDAAAVEAWRGANSLRASFGRRFEGGDLIEDLTARDYRGGRMTNALDPRDASNAILGQGRGVRSSSDLTRDLERIRSMAPEAFESLRAEGSGRLATMRGEQVAPEMDVLRRQNPRLADLLSNAQLEGRLSSARTAVSGAQRERSVIETGQRVLSATPDVFAQASPGAALRNSTVNRMVDSIGGSPIQSINQAARNPNTRANLAHALGPDQADAYSDQMRLLGDRLRNAQFVNPGAGSKTAQASMDAGEAVGFVSGLVSGGKTAALSIISKLAAGTRLSSEDRQALVRMGISEAQAIRASQSPHVIGYLVAPTARLEGQIAGQGTSQ